MNHSNRNKRLLLDAVRSTKELIVFDTETSGLDPKNDTMIQFSGIKVRVYEENGVYKYDEISVIDEYIKPEVPISQKIEEITSITNDFLEDKPSEDVVFPKIREFFGNNPVISGYNINFDIRMVDALYQRHLASFDYTQGLDVMLYAKDLVSKQDLMEATGTDSFKQEMVATVYGLNEGVAFHLAIEDARVTLKLLFTFINEYLMEENVDRRKARVKRVLYNKGFQHDRTGVYAMTDICPVFFSFKYKQWYPTKKDNLPLFETIDLDSLENDVLRMTNCKDLTELGHYRGDTSTKIEEGENIAISVSGINRWEKYGKSRIYVKVMDRGSQWHNCFYDINSNGWSCQPFSSHSVEELVLREKGVDSMPELLKAI